MLCGDEVRAAVMDLGSSFCRFGAAGQGLPTHVYKTDVGLRELSSSSSGGDSSSSS